MSFLSSFFFLLIPLVSIPLIIHLLNKRNIVTLNFSSIRFLKALESESIKKLHFIQLLLMIIRAIIILLIIIMMTRPLINGIYPISTINPESTISVIFIDDTFSNNGNIGNTTLVNSIIGYFDEIISNFSDKQYIQLYMLNKGLVYSGPVNELGPIGKFFNITYYGTPLNRYLTVLNDKFYAKYINKELYIITDTNKNTFNNITGKQLLDWNVYILQTEQLRHNLGIINTSITEEVIIPNNPFNFEVNINNSGTEDIDNAFIKIFMDNTAIAQQNISLNSNSSKAFNFNLIVTNNEYTRIKVELSKDDNKHDNSYYHLINIPTEINITLIYDNPSDFQFLKSAISAINYSNRIFNIEEYSTNLITYANILNSDIVFLSGYEAVKKYFTDIERYVVGGGSITIFPNNSDIDLSGLLPFIEINQSNSFTELAPNSYIKTDINGTKDYDFRDIILPSNNNSEIEISKYAEIPLSDDTVIPLNGGLSFLSNKQYDNGNINIFSVSPVIAWSDLPLKGLFIPLIHHIISTAKDISTSNLIVPDYWVIKADELIGFNNIEIYYDGQTFLYPNNSNMGYVEINNLNKPGFYSTLNTENPHQASCNVSKDEIASERMSKDQFEELFAKKIVFIDKIKNTKKLINSSRKGKEIWRYFLYLLIFFVSIEMIISNGNKQKKTI